MIYSRMVDRVAEYLDRTDLGTSASDPVSSTKIGEWMNDTRKDIALKYDFNYLYEEATISTSAGSAYYELPTYYMGHLTVVCGYKKLARIGAREFDELYYTRQDEQTTPSTIELNEASDGSAGPPEYYIDRGMYIQLFPTPDTTYTITMKYYSQPVDFGTLSTSGADEDYMARFHFEPIIFGTALRGALYLDDVQKIQNFQVAYDRALQEIVNKEKEKKAMDKKIRVKSWKDYDLIQFRQLFKVDNS